MKDIILMDGAYPKALANLLFDYFRLTCVSCIRRKLFRQKDSYLELYLIYMTPGLFTVAMMFPDRNIA